MRCFCKTQTHVCKCVPMYSKRHAALSSPPSPAALVTSAERGMEERKRPSRGLLVGSPDKPPPVTVRCRRVRYGSCQMLRGSRHEKVYSVHRLVFSQITAHTQAIHEHTFDQRLRCLEHMLLLPPPPPPPSGHLGPLLLTLQSSFQCECWASSHFYQ